MFHHRSKWTTGVGAVLAFATVSTGLFGAVSPSSAVVSECLDIFDPASVNYVGSTAGTYECQVETGSAAYSYVVRAGYGGSGIAGGPYYIGALGAKITGDIQVSAGETLLVRVGAPGEPALSGGSPVISAGASGGGASGIVQNGAIFLVAGGGGGDGQSSGKFWGRGGVGGVGSAGAIAAGTAGSDAEYNSGRELYGGAGGSSSGGGAGGSSSYGDGYGGPGGDGGALGSAGGVGGAQGGGGGAGFTTTGPGASGGNPSDCSAGTSAAATVGGGGGGSCSGGGGGGYTGGGGGGVVNGRGASGGGGSSLIPVGATAVATAADDADALPRVEFTLTTPPTPPAPEPPSGGGGTAAVIITIGLNANGGEGSIPALSGDQGSWAVLPGDQGLYKPGFEFAGWNNAPDGSGAGYPAGASVELNFSGTLYAQWRIAGGSTESAVTEPQLDPSRVGLPADGLPAGATQLLSNGRSVDVTVVPNRKADPFALVVQSQGLNPPLNMRLEGRGDDSDPLGLTSKQVLILQSMPVTRIRAKGQPVAQSSGDGFKASSPVKFYLLADTYLGTLTTDETGAYSGSLPIPDGITPGVHTLQVNGVAPDGSVRSLSIGVQVIRSAVKAVTAKSSAKVYFAPLSAQLSTSAKATLTRLAKKVGKRAMSSMVVGYVQPTSNTGNDQSLSTARAKKVAAYLRSQGVTGSFTIRGDGRAKETGATARRVQVTITYNKG